MKTSVELDYNTYLQRKERGEDVVMYYEQLGFILCPDVRADFAIIYLSTDELTLYQYHVDKEGKFQIKPPVVLNHSLMNVITTARMNDKQTQAWWASLFFENANGDVSYDAYYDDFPVTNNEDLTCREYISQLMEALPACEISSQKVFVFGEWKDCGAIRYVISKRYGAFASKLNPFSLDILSNGSLVINPLVDRLERFHLSMEGNRGMAYTLYDLSMHPIQIYVPIDDVSLNEKLINSKIWRDILPNTDIDYSINGTDIHMKIVSLSASYDAFGNVFLTCYVNNKKKVIRLC